MPGGISYTSSELLSMAGVALPGCQAWQALNKLGLCYICRPTVRDKRGGTRKQRTITTLIGYRRNDLQLVSKHISPFSLNITEVHRPSSKEKYRKHYLLSVKHQICQK